MKPRQKKWMFWGCLLIPVFAPLTLICLMGFNVFHAHEHCIKQAGLGFRTYAMDNDGRLPYDTNGFGNALLLLVKGGYLGDTDGVSSLQRRIMTPPFMLILTIEECRRVVEVAE